MSNYEYYVINAAGFELKQFFSLGDMTSQRERVIKFEYLPPGKRVRIRIFTPEKRV